MTALKKSQSDNTIRRNRKRVK